MKKTWIITALLTLVIGAPCAFAKKPKGEKTADAFSRYDKNGNGSIDGDEIAAVKAALATDADLKKFDTDSDGKLSDNEIAAMKPAEKKKKKKN
ncbi:MAG: EF-hand domain-containing protein, partial [Verrucomicrobiaceae bacterium]